MTAPPTPRVPAWLERAVPARYRDAWIGDLLERWSAETGAGVPRWRATAAFWRRLAWSVVVGRARAPRTSGIAQDVRMALRLGRRDPVTAGAAFVTLALGVWVFLTAYALADAALLKPLGYPHEDRLALVGHDAAAFYGVSLPDHDEFVANGSLFEAGGAWQSWGVLLRSTDEAWQRLGAASVSSGYFEVLDAAPALGRLFGEADDRPGHPPAVVLGHALWRDRFGADPSVVGRALDLGDGSYTVVGVMEPGFRDPLPRLLGWASPQLWRVSPPSFDVATADRGQVSYWSLGRLRPGVAAPDATRQIRARTAERLGVDASEVEIAVRSYTQLFRDGARGSLLMLASAGLVVLLVAAGNLTNLFLAQGTRRAREMAVRRGLGASSGRLVRQLLVEGGVLGLVAGAAGCLAAAVTLPLAARAAASILPEAMEVALTPRAAAVALVAALAAALVAAGVPALRARSEGAMAGLRQGTRGGDRTPRVQSGLVTAQLALAVVLVTASTLLLRSLWALSAERPGFDASEVSAASVSLYPELFAGADEQTATLDAIVARLGALPGVESAASITDPPMSGRINSTRVRRADLPESDERHVVQTLVRAISPAYFDVMGISLVEGRALEPGDAPGAPDVAVVNETYARRHFGGESPLGRTVVVRNREREIVGVVADVSEFSLGQAGDPVLYLTYAQEAEPWMRASTTLVVRRPAEGLTLREVRTAVDEVDRRVPVGTPFVLTRYLERDTAPHRFRALLAALFGAVALGLSAVGLAGVMAFLVARKRREVGVRVALGANSGGVARLVLGRIAVLAALGVAVGLAGALVVVRLLAAYLYGVDPLDPPALLAGAAILAATAALSAVWPVRRALAISPVEALAAE